MDISYNIPAFSILFSMFCAIIMLALKPRAALLLFRIEIALIAAGSCVLLFHFLNGAPAFTYSMGHFGAPFGNELRAGALEAGMALLVAVVITLSLNGGSLHLKADIIIEKQNLYYISLSLLTCSMMALIYTNDLFTAYVFIEINTITACAMVMSKRDVHTLSATITYLIMSLIGSGLFLLSICMLYGITGHLLMTPIQETIAQIPANSPYMRPLYGAMAMFAVGIGLKSAMWPFSFWLPEAHASASTTSSAILSGLVLKVYIFTLVKVYFRVIGINVVLGSGINNILFVFGCLSMIVGSLGAIRCKDIKRMLAHSSIAQIGYVFCALGIGNLGGMVAAAMQIVVHAVTKSMLFVAAGGFMDTAWGSKKFKDLAGKGWEDPLAGLAFAVGAMSMIGIPCFAGFISKYAMIEAAVDADPHIFWGALVTIILSTVLTAVYYLKALAVLFRVPEEETGFKKRMAVAFRSIKTLDGEYGFALICFIALNFFFGFGADLLRRIVEYGLNMFG